jgi:hypothetical protein
VATAATGVGETSFTANWNAFSGASYYLLDVSTSSSFSSFVGSYQNFVVISNSQVVSGLTANTTYYYRLRAATGVDADAASFFSRVYTAGGALSYTEVSATETLVASLKANSLWTPMKAIYPMVGASAAACAQNLKSSSFTGTFTSGWTFASTGVTPNGTSAYMNTNCNPSTNMSSFNSHLSFYSRTDNTAYSVPMGCQDPVSFFRMRLKQPASFFTHTIQNTVSTWAVSDSVTNSLGFYLGSRTSNAKLILQKNSTILNTSTVTETIGLPNQNVWLGGLNNNGSYQEGSVYQCAFASVGDGLTDTQASDFYTAVQAFQTTLSRQV